MGIDWTVEPVSNHFRRQKQRLQSLSFRGLVSYRSTSRLFIASRLLVSLQVGRGVASVRTINKRCSWADITKGDFWWYILARCLWVNLLRENFAPILMSGRKWTLFKQEERDYNVVNSLFSWFMNVREKRAMQILIQIWRIISLCNLSGEIL